MKKFFIGLALFILVFANVGFAQDIDVTFTVTWNPGTVPYNVGASATLFIGGGVNQVIGLTSNAAFTVYTGTFEDPVSQVDSYSIVWNQGEYNWLPPVVAGDNPWGGIDRGSIASID